MMHPAQREDFLWRSPKLSRAFSILPRYKRTCYLKIKAMASNLLAMASNLLVVDAVYVQRA